MKRTAKAPRSCAGFSLVEIVLCIGIISFAFVSILGLLPAGMNVFRSSMNASIGAQLVQLVLNEAQQTEFEVLTGGPAPKSYYEFVPVRYFDGEGNELPAPRRAESIYHLRAIVQNLPKFPDATGKNTVAMNDLATVVVQVATNPGQHALDIDETTLLWKATPNVPIQNFPALVARHD
jgi:uncharacterized protein (TIGR02598 family)